MKQKDAVFNAVVSTLKENDISFSEETPVHLTTAHLQDVISIIAAGFKSGTVDLSDEARLKYDDDAKRKKYASSLTKNWLKRDTRLTGGVEYTPDETSTRGPRDEELKQINRLLKQVKSAGSSKEIVAQVEEAAETRKAFIAAARAKSEEIDADKLPESLRHLI